MNDVDALRREAQRLQQVAAGDVGGDNDCRGASGHDGQQQAHGGDAAPRVVVAIEKERGVVDGNHVGSRLVERGDRIRIVDQIGLPLAERTGQDELHPQPTAGREIGVNLRRPAQFFV